MDGYYVRIGPIDLIDDVMPPNGLTVINESSGRSSRWPSVDIVSPDALALVRFGLRSAHDPRILNTLRVIDAPAQGRPATGAGLAALQRRRLWRARGWPAIDGGGIGRAWPLLAGERAHYEIAAGRPDEAQRLLRTLEACASDVGLIPEQVWDRDDIPEHELFRGKASGSAMPLVWAHAEHVKLLRSLKDGRVFDMPPEPLQRYQAQGVTANFVVWRFDRRRRTVADKNLRIEVLEPGPDPLVQRRLAHDPRLPHAGHGAWCSCLRPAGRNACSRHHHRVHAVLAPVSALGRNRFLGSSRGTKISRRLVPLWHSIRT